MMAAWAPSASAAPIETPTWTTRGTAPLYISEGGEHVAFVDRMHGWVADEGGTVSATMDGGATWSPQSTGVTAAFRSICFTDAAHGWIVGVGRTAAVVLATSDGGAHWNQQSIGQWADLRAVYFTDNSHGWISGVDYWGNGIILVTSDGGAHWTNQLTLPNTFLGSTCFVDSQHGWVLGEDTAALEDVVLVTTDGGAHWTTQNTGVFGLSDISFVDRQRGWAVGYFGIILATEDGGATWTDQSTDSFEGLHSVQFLDTTRGWAVGDSSTILATTDGGQNWLAQSCDASTTSFSQVGFVDPGYGWVVSADGIFLTYTDPSYVPTVPPTNVYRFYNKINGSHFYTASSDERDMVLSRWPDVYSLDGVAYSINTTNPANSSPLYRFHNKKNGSHFYTAFPDERDTVLHRWSDTFSLDGPAYNVCTAAVSGATPVYRFFNKVNGSHFYTASAEERDIVKARWPDTYALDGIAFWIAP